MDTIKDLINNQKNFFESNKTKDINFIIKNLKKLKKIVKDNEEEILNSLKVDLGKSDFEGYTSEIGMVYDEINYMIKNLKKLSKPKKVRTSIVNFKSTGYIYKEPYGRVLIIAPWNYPINLSLVPLAGAIAAGNCVVLKPSEYSINTSMLLEKLISDNFNSNYIKVILGDAKVSSEILDYKFDMIFFTGGTSIGKIVMNKASKYLTPVVLELGGKSPCIVDETAKISLAAKRIIWGKGLNAGQTCVAPDYIYVHRSIKDNLIKELIKNIEIMYGNESENCNYMPKIINEKHYNRILNLIDKDKIVYGGSYNTKEEKISLTILDNVNFKDKVMEEEIFGPIIPIITFDSLDEIIKNVNERPRPLALYLFTTSKESENEILTNISFGGGCINDTIIHLANSNLPFGGVGDSGIGSYHGSKSFDVFSHSKSILKKSNLIDIPMRYPPYNKSLNLIRKILK